MFKKLKDKIVEEAKNSPQRFQQITQSVSDKLQQSSTAEENFFSIDDDVDSRPSISTTPPPPNDGGFTSVSLHTSTPMEPRQRRTSNSSMASDVSFLPRYESANMYHLQSDIEASASEMEDNVSTSSTQMGHITKEQVYAELQRVRLRYHKYRGRYTDLANHYKDLERENGKMKSVLVETQDVSIRRIGELREQCQLEQKAKAHLENALRVEIDEKQYIIDTLKTKIELLNSSNISEIVFEAENANGALTNGNSTAPSSPEYNQLSTDLTNAKSEIAALNERLQELKASKIISQTKEANLLTRINELEAEMAKNTNNNNSKLSKLAELEAKVVKMGEMESKLAKMAELENKVAKMAEQEAKLTQLIQDKDKMEADRLKQQKSDEDCNLQMARDKRTLHTELQNKDLEIKNLKSDLETLREELDTYEKEAVPKNAANNTRMDNLQSQNTKLIDKVELLTAKCNNMEAELLKMEQLRQENKHLSETANNLKQVNKGFSKELSDLNKLKDNLGDTTEALEMARNDITLLSEEKTNVQQELENFIKSNAFINEKFSNLNMEHNDLDAKYNKLLIDNTSLSDSLISKNGELEKVRSDAKSSLLTLEAKITKKLQQKFDQRSDKMAKEYEEKVNKLSVNDESVKAVHAKLLAREDSITSLEDDLTKINEELNASRKKYDELETNHLELIEENRENAAEKRKLLSEKTLFDKKLENTQIMIEQLKQQLEAKFLEVTSLKESSKINKTNLEDKIRNLEQILQDKDYHIAESTSKINNDIKDYKATIESFEEVVKAKNNEIDHIKEMLQESTNQINAQVDLEKKEFGELIKILQNDLNTAKSNNDILNNNLLEKNKEINVLESQVSIKEDNLKKLTDKLKVLTQEINKFSKNNEKLKQEKLDAAKQVEKLLEEKLFGQKQLTTIISEIKEEFKNVQTENNNYQKQLEELGNVKKHFIELELKHKELCDENRNLTMKIDEIYQEKTSVHEEMILLRNTMSDSSKQSDELVRLNAEKVELVKEVSDLNKILDNMSSDQKRFKEQIVDLQILKEEMGQAVEERDKCLQEISNLKGNLQRLVNDRQHLEQQSAQLHDVQRQNSVVTSELAGEREKTARLNDQLSLVTVRGRQLEEDRDRLVEDTERMVIELEQMKLLMEVGQNPSKNEDDSQQQIKNLTSELTSARAQIAAQASQLEANTIVHVQTTQLLNESPHNQNQSSINAESNLQQKITELSEMTKRFETIFEENRSVKEELVEVGRLKEEVDGERRRLELMVGDMDRSYSEMKHENQLLKDEIQELKISPMNLTSSSKPSNVNNSNLANGNNNNTTATENPDLTKELDQLKEKLQQYKAIDATNRSSIEFFELELDRARARGDKLERKLDETLVTLRHCAELSGVDTQVEYLRHVLYNYMLGREGVVLARVIAAVCKFDPVQTDAVLKHEQQKQTLLGQLGIL